MNLDHLDRAFARLGARVKFGDGAIDIGTDALGEFFRLNLTQARDDGYHATDVQPRRRHLVLTSLGEVNERFLCGHDERHWFVASVPSAGRATVDAAMDALRPRVATEALHRHGVRHRRRHRRHNEAYLRQGEWFFIPRPDFAPPDGVVVQNERLSRGGKPHLVDILCRVGGETVHVSREYPSGLTSLQMAHLKRSSPEVFARQRWNTRTRDAKVFVRGRVRHPDHATLVLDGWHEVALSLEQRSQQVAFLD